MRNLARIVPAILLATALTACGGKTETDSAEPAASGVAPADLVLLEGFKRADVPKLLCHRQACRQSPDLSLPGVRAVASDVALDLALPVLRLDDTEAIADFIESALR